MPLSFDLRGELLPNKPLKLPAAGFRRAATVLDPRRGSITRGCSLAAIRWAANSVKSLAALLVLAPAACSGHVGLATQLQEISHQGVLRFRVPSGWSAQLRDGGGAVYWDPSGNSGVLRLDLLTFNRSGAVTEDSALEVVSHPEKPDSRIGRLENGNALAEYEESTKEDGEALHMWFWELASVVPPRHLRLAIFSYTVIAREAALPRTLRTVALLRSEIAAATFAAEPGVLPP